MRKICFAVGALFLLSSCASRVPVLVKEAKVISATLDYTEFIRSGFYITESNSVNFEYTPVASVSSFVRSGGKDGPYMYKNIRSYQQNQLNMEARDAVKKIYDEAKRLGANGIINLNVRYVIDTDTDLNGGYEASGMAILK